MTPLCYQDEVLVFSTNKECDFTKQSRCGTKLVQAGGQNLQDEATKQFPNGIKAGEFGNISAGPILSKQGCKRIYFTTLPPWDDDEYNDPAMV